MTPELSLIVLPRELQEASLHHHIEVLDSYNASEFPRSLCRGNGLAQQSSSPLTCPHAVRRSGATLTFPKDGRSQVMPGIARRKTENDASLEASLSAAYIFA
jgi:hypothetical protein